MLPGSVPRICHQLQFPVELAQEVQFWVAHWSHLVLKFENGLLFE